MPLREDSAPVWAIWLLIAFGAVQPLAWWLGVGFQSVGGVLLLAGIVMLLASTRRGREPAGLSRR